MYCQNCGEKIIEIEGARFCRRCGRPVETQRKNKQTTQRDVTQQKPRNEVNQRANIRQQETAELQKMIRYFSQKSDQYREYDRLAYIMNPTNRNAPISLLIWGIICGFAGIALWSLSLSAKEYYTFTLRVTAIFLLLGCAVLMGMYFVYSKSRKKEYEKNSVRFEELSNELYRHYQNYGYCLVSAEYTNPENLKAILQTIESGRADTIKEAINILVEDAHRNNMQNYAAQTAASSAAAARGATVSAVFSAANFFKRR